MVPAIMARNAEFREIAATVRSQRTDAADLNADGTEVGEAAQRERRDGERTGIKHGFLRARASNTRPIR